MAQSEMSDVPLTPAEITELLPTWYKEPQGCDIPRNISLRVLPCNMTLGGSTVHVYPAQVKLQLDSQNPQIEVSVSLSTKAKVVFTFDDTEITLGVEGSGDSTDSIFKMHRSAVPDAFLAVDQQGVVHHWKQAKLLSLAPIKPPTVLGFLCPKVNLSPLQVQAWNNLKRIRVGEKIYLWQQNVPDQTQETEWLRVWINDISKLIQKAGTFWYRKVSGPEEENRVAPIWLHAPRRDNRFQIQCHQPSANTGGFLNQADRLQRLVDGSYLERVEQNAIFDQVFNLWNFHEASIEVDSRNHLFIHVNVAGGSNAPSLPELTMVKFLIGATGPVEDEFFKTMQRKGKIVERPLYQADLVIEHFGELPNGVKAGKTVGILMTVDINTTVIPRQIEALHDSALPCVVGDTPDGKGKGFSLLRTVLAHNVEMESGSNLYFELSLKDLSAISSRLTSAERDALLNNIKQMWTDRLDESQAKAVRNSVECIREGLSLITGSPGTGKTFTAVFIIAAALTLEVPLLLTAASNEAVDNLLSALHRFASETGVLNLLKFPVIRLRAAELQMAMLRSQSASSNKGPKVTLVDPDMECYEAHVQAISFAERRRGTDPMYDEFLKLWKRDIAWGLCRDELVQFQKLYQYVLRQLLPVAGLVATTLNNAGSAKDSGFQPVFMVCDEAGQAVEGDTMLGMLHPTLRAVVLIGDPDQLGPTVVSVHGNNEWAHFLKRPLIARLNASGYDFQSLKTNYRNHPEILAFFNERVYNRQLTAHPLNASPLNHDLLRAGNGFDRFMQVQRQNKLAGRRRLWVDVPSWATRERLGTSWENLAQAEAVVRLLLGFAQQTETDLGSGVKAQDIMIISPYRAQQRLMASFLAQAHLTVRANLTIDGAQGQEAPIVIFMLTNPEQQNPSEIGLLGDRSRLNVALSRAQQVLLIVGNAAAFTKRVKDQLTAKRAHLLKAFINDVEGNGHRVAFSRLNFPVFRSRVALQNTAVQQTRSAPKADEVDWEQSEEWRALLAEQEALRLRMEAFKARMTNRRG